jgi:hypothetical protein
MATLRLIVCVAILGLAVDRARAQVGSDALKKELDAIRANQNVLNEVIATKEFQEEMPFSKFLDAWQKLVATTQKSAIRIDGKAFGDKRPELLKAPVRLPAVPSKMTLGTALRLVLTQVGDGDYAYRVDAVGIVIVSTSAPNTPTGAVHAATYDIGDLVEHSARRKAIQRAATIVQTLVGDRDRLPGKQEELSIEVRNGTKLSVRASARGHIQVQEVLQALRRVADLSVILRAQLYEVDNTFYTRLKSTKRVPLDEAEKQFLAGKAPKDELFKILEKLSPVQVGDDPKVKDGSEMQLLSRHDVITCLPNPHEIMKLVGQGPAPNQTVLEGVAFPARVQVTPDRRFVRLTLTQKATELEALWKFKVATEGLMGAERVGADAKDWNAEIPLVLESTDTRQLEIPDGGSILVPVSYRPLSLKDKNRWWVLSITPRIVIEEEEQQIRQGMLDDILPKLVADVLNNPRLKATRDLYGTPGDKRFALIKSDWFTWPENTLVAGFQVTSAQKGGKRLLGIRVDRFDETMVTVTLLNAGGTDNGEAIGTCTVRYRAKAAEKGYSVELVAE